MSTRRHHTPSVQHEPPPPSPQNKNIDYGDTVKRPKSYAFFLPVSFMMGICFGFALEKGRVFEPAVIVDQFLLARFQMLKMFLSAVATSILVMVAFYSFPQTTPFANFGRMHHYKSPRGLIAVIIGAMFLGFGMALSGACPGTATVQIGALVQQGPFIILGGVIAGILFVMLEPFLQPLTKLAVPIEQNRTVDKALHTNYARVALPLFLLLVSVVACLEWFFPWESELPHMEHIEDMTVSVLSKQAWPPYIAGIVVGLMQVPAYLLVKVSLGSSSSYEVIAVNILYLVNPKMVEKSDKMCEKRTGIALWQPVYLIGSIFGAFLSSSLSGTIYTVTSYSPLLAIAGGFFLVFGSRVSGGCTSGHGISGFSQLSLNSFVAVPVMFLTAIPSAFVLRALNFY